MANMFIVLKKASFWAPFVFLGITNSHADAPDTCRIQQTHETVTISKVYDGDTVKLQDGRKLRLIGINTPERGKQGNADEPYYQQAKQHLHQLVKASSYKVRLQYGKEQYDRYGRLLAHLFSLSGANLTQELLSNGAGYALYIPPNLGFNQCYANSEKQARINKKGLWHPSLLKIHPAQQVTENLHGFMLVSGQVQKVGESKSSFWLNLDNHFALRIHKKDIRYFKHLSPYSLTGKNLIARGWITHTQNQSHIKVRHPLSLKIIAD